MKLKNIELSEIDESVVFKVSFWTSFKKKVKQFFLNTERRTSLDDFGIYLTIVISFILLAFNFISNPYITNMTYFYESFDIRVLLFIIIYFAGKKIKKTKKEELKVFEFPTILDFLYMIVFSICMLGVVMLLNRFLLFNLFSGGLNNFMDLLILELFTHLRVIATEELVFRGLGIFLITYPLTYYLNKDEDNTKEFIIWMVAIVIIGILFGLFHFPRYYNEVTYPYFYYFGEKIHIAYPIVYLIILGVAMGFARYKYGLTSAILIHFINNFFAQGIIFIFFLG
jgi:hypothetical protein